MATRAPRAPGTLKGKTPRRAQAPEGHKHPEGHRRRAEPRREERRPEPAAPRKPEVKGASLDDLLAKFNKGIR